MLASAPDLHPKTFSEKCGSYHHSSRSKESYSGLVGLGVQMKASNQASWNYHQSLSRRYSSLSRGSAKMNQISLVYARKLEELLGNTIPTGQGSVTQVGTLSGVTPISYWVDDWTIPYPSWSPTPQMVELWEELVKSSELLRHTKFPSSILGKILTMPSVKAYSAYWNGHEKLPTREITGTFYERVFGDRTAPRFDREYQRDACFRDPHIRTIQL